MEKRMYKKTKENVSLLGFGCMRLPRVTEENQDIEEKTAEEMIDFAYNNGVNYFDTAYPYHEGKSEIFIGKALKKYPRDSYYLADKMPGWYVNCLDDARRIFKEQLQKCQTDYFDYYLCHALCSYNDDFLVRYEDGKKTDCKNQLLSNENSNKESVFEYLKQEKKAGRIRKLGFSFHGEYEDMVRLLDYYPWDFVQIQLNYLDWDVQYAKALYQLLEEREIPCIIMEPVRGGNLCSLCEESIQMLKKERPDKSAASWAIRFAASLPNVLTVLSGMSTLEQVEDNVKTMSPFEPLSQKEQLILRQALDAYLKTNTIPCTGCRYCMDCPAGVDIPEVFNLYNQCASAGKLPVSLGEQKSISLNQSYMFEIFMGIGKEKWPQNCVSCKKCMEHCPQKIQIPARLAEVAKLLGK